MITTAEFKKQIGKPFGNSLRELGFKGCGFNYKMDNENFVFTIGIQASQYGEKCCAEFGIQPKAVETNGFENHDFKKIKYYDCEFRTRIYANEKNSDWWNYSNNEIQNIQTAKEIAELIKSRVLPIINEFKQDPKILEKIETSDLTNIYVKVGDKIGGMRIMNTDIRLSWVLAKCFEKSNPKKAAEFAKYGLDLLKEDDKFFARKDLEKIYGIKNSA